MSNNTPIQISTPTGLIAALPGLIGFVPAASEVLVILKDQEILLTARHDFTTAPEVAAHIIEVARSHDATAVLLVAITDELAEATTWLDTAARIAELSGLQVVRTIHTPSCEVGAQWTDVGTGETGLTEDFRDSAVTTARVMGGRAVNASRQQIEATFTLTEPVDLTTAEPITALNVARQVYTLITSNTAPTTQFAAQAARAISNHPGVRDALIVVGSTEPAAAAHLFITIAAALRGQDRAEMLTLVAVLSSLSGNGAQANVAIDQAQASATTTPPLLDLIEQATTAGISPDMLRQAIITPLHEHASDILGGDYIT